MPRSWLVTGWAKGHRAFTRWPFLLLFSLAWFPLSRQAFATIRKGDVPGLLGPHHAPSPFSQSWERKGALSEAKRGEGEGYRWFFKTSGTDVCSMRGTSFVT